MARNSIMCNKQQILKPRRLFTVSSAKFELRARYAPVKPAIQPDSSSFFENAPPANSDAIIRLEVAPAAVALS
jgi:hypothetical protein